MPERLIGLDLGSSSAKAVLIRPGGERSAIPVARRALATRVPGPGRIEQDGEEILSAALATLGEVLRRGGRRSNGRLPRHRLGIATQRSTILFWDRDTGRPLTPAYSWQDRRGAVMCDRLRHSGSAAGRTGRSERHRAVDTAALVAARTGLRLSPHYSASKLAWALRNVRGLRRRIISGRALWGTLGTFILYHLSGGAYYAIDHASAQRTSLMGIDDLAWDPELFELFGLEPLLDTPVLPAILPTMPSGQPDIVLGRNRIGIGALTGDQQAAIVGRGGLRADRILINYGSGAFVLRPGVEGARSARGLLRTLVASWRREETSGLYPAMATRFALEGTVNAAGIALDWVLRRCGLRIPPTKIDRFLGPAPEGVRALHFLPAVGGLGAPYWEARARPRFSGDVRSATDRDLVRAVIESVAQRCAEIALLMGPLPLRDARSGAASGSAILASGGLTACRTLMQAQADLLQCPVIIDPVPEATALGAAAMAAGDPERLFGGECEGIHQVGAALHHRRPGALIIPPRIGRDEAAARRRAWRRAVYGRDGAPAAFGS